MSLRRKRRSGRSDCRVSTVADLLRRRVSAVWLLPLLIGLVATSLGWFLAIRPAEPAWGTVADWVAGLSQAGAVAFLAWQIALIRGDQAAGRDREVRAEAARRRATKDAVGVAFTLGARGYLICDVVNGGPFAIHAVTIRPVGITPDGPIVADEAHAAGVIFPNETKQRELALPASLAGAEEVAVIVEFSDPAGEWFRRVIDQQGGELDDQLVSAT
ncbi:MAG TPA: hypothetical protein VF062_05550 [Candidatus Limnocylindrales bacterium]